MADVTDMNAWAEWSEWLDAHSEDPELIRCVENIRRTMRLIPSADERGAA